MWHFLRMFNKPVYILFITCVNIIHELTYNNILNLYSILVSEILN